MNFHRESGGFAGFYKRFTILQDFPYLLAHFITQAVKTSNE